ncbi:MAG: hypothetical protein KGJ06_00675 [Pseudomonadota bacterium]|nr:hypothetical protein [Pseudomonadota bacterium]
MNKLMAEHGCRLHSDVGPVPADIDLYVPPAQMEGAAALLISEGYVLTGRNIFQRVYRRFEGGQLFILDLISDFNVYTQHLSLLRLSSVGNERLSRSPDLHRCFKYVCFRRRDKIAFIESHHRELAAFLKDGKNFARISPALHEAAEGSAMDVFAAVKSSFLGWLQPRLAMLGNGYTMAFIGPDGSGKSFFIEKLRRIGVTRTLYMGDWFFLAQRFYNLLMKIPSPWNRFIYGFYIIENYLRWLHVCGLRFLGRIVLIDRFPGTSRNVVHDGLLNRINQFIFRIFPKPDLLVLLHASPEIVHQRKQELSVESIARIQQQLRVLLADTRHVVLDTERLDESLNRVLAAAYARLEEQA